MKQTLVFLTLALAFCTPPLVIAQSNIAPSAALEINSTSKGFLPPRMTTAQRDAISSPAQGLVIYNTTTNRLNGYNGSNWSAFIIDDGVNNITDTDGDTQVQAEETANEDILRFDTAGVERLQITKSGNMGVGTTSVASSALMELNSTTQGFLPPRMTTTQRDAISDVATGLLIYNSSTHKMNYYSNSGQWRDVFFNQSEAVFWNARHYGIILSTTGRYWLDRNLGASQVATGTTDANAFGDLYQWGRTSDGHQLRTSSTATGTVTAGNEGGDFVTNSGGTFDWLTTKDDSRWNGTTKGAHDPCPEGFRVPTKAEFNAEGATFSPTNRDGAFASILKLPIAGRRAYDTGNLAGAASGNYWSSSVNGSLAGRFYFNTTLITTDDRYRSFGFSIRCIKEEE